MTLTEDIARDAATEIRRLKQELRAAKRTVYSLLVILLAAVIGIVLMLGGGNDRGESPAAPAVSDGGAGGVCVVACQFELAGGACAHAVWAQTHDAGASRRKRWLLRRRHAEVV